MSRLTAAANPPKITALRQQLGYGDVGTDRYNTFIDDVRAFRRRFHTRQDQDGISLFTWSSPEHQRGLSEMATAYLETSGCLFWPDSSSATDGDSLRFSRDNAKYVFYATVVTVHLTYLYRIKSPMKQLFFRLNEQEVCNHKYKNKPKSTPSAEGISSRGRSSEEPIELDVVGDSAGIMPKPSLVDITSL